MRRHRVTLAGLMGGVVAIATAFAALRAASPAWADAYTTAVIVLLTLSVVAATCSCDRSRAFRGGFATGGSLYFVLSCGLFCEASIGPRLVTTAMLDLAYEHVARPQPIVRTKRPGDARLEWRTDFAAQQAEAIAAHRWYESLGLDRDLYGWGNPTRLHSPVEFRRIGHAWFTPLVGCLVGVAARRFHDTRPRGGEPS